ncbi:Vts1p [Sporobolomyces salmoneus]|uniref:Vts1p n=1 Tax=Sporobolomyces salmoneus TaxID=183962 RepID=UPI00316BEF95
MASTTTSTRHSTTPTPNVSLPTPSPRPFSQAGSSSPQPPPPPAPSTRFNNDQHQPSKFRASMGVPLENTRWGPSNSTNNATTTSSNAANALNNPSNGLRGISPGRASTGGAGLGGFGAGGGGQGQSAMNQSQGVFHSAETEAIDRWFEDLQHYEATLEEMAAASLDTNFKEELSAIEQWFRVLSEAERTAALYSLLQSATQMQMRFFITVLQQMARSDPTQAALLSPANPNQLSLEAQMEQKLSTLAGSKSPSSPMIRQFARSSLGPNTNPNTVANEAYLSPNPDDSSSAPGATLAAQRAKLKASSRTSAPANLVLGNSANGGGMGLGVGGTGEGLKSPLWSKEETVRERSPSPRPKSTGSTGESQSTLNASNSQSFLRSPALDSSFSAVENQLSPLVGGNWASMVNTPLVPMFGKNGETMEPGNYGGTSPNPNLDSLGQRLGNWQQQSQNGGIVLDDVRKFRRSARVSGGALSGMYEGESSKENNNNSSSTSSFHSSATTAQKRVQDQLQAVQQLKNMQQSALSLGLGSLPSPGLNGSTSSQQQQPSSGGSSRVGSSGALNSPGLQQTAMQAQQNWRLQNAPQLAQSASSSSNNNQYASNSQQYSGHQSPNNLTSFNLGGNSADQFANIGLGTNLTLPSGLGSPSAQQAAQQQLASLIALQQQMMQQQQQLQTLAGLSPNGNGGLGVGMGLGGLGMMGTGANLSPNMAALASQMMSQQQSQISPRLGGGGNGHGHGHGGGGNQNNFGLGMGMGGMGLPSPRRSPRPHDRSPTSFAMTSHRSGNSSTASQLPSGSGSNPDEPLDFSLLGDTPSWLRSLRLHKYTPNFEGIGWKEMVKMTDEDLEKRGVSALGARRKLIKVFETVRSKTGMSDHSAPAMDPSTSTDSTSPRSSTNNTNNDANDNNNDNSQAEKEKESTEKTD